MTKQRKRIGVKLQQLKFVESMLNWVLSKLKFQTSTKKKTFQTTGKFTVKKNPLNY
jgi:hypothetical protein